MESLMCCISMVAGVFYGHSRAVDDVLQWCAVGCWQCRAGTLRRADSYTVCHARWISAHQIPVSYWIVLLPLASFYLNPSFSLCLSWLGFFCQPVTSSFSIISPLSSSVTPWLLYLTFVVSGPRTARNHPALGPPSSPVCNHIVTIRLSEPLGGSCKPHKRTPAHLTAILCLHNIRSEKIPAQDRRGSTWTKEM